MVKFFLFDCELKLTHQQVYSSYALSKMSVKRENENHEMYMRLELVEFLDMIARVAHVRFRSLEQMSLTDKIIAVLEQILVFVSARVLRAGVTVVMETSSEDDY